MLYSTPQLYTPKIKTERISAYYIKKKSPTTLYKKGLSMSPEITLIRIFFHSLSGSVSAYNFRFCFIKFIKIIINRMRLLMEIPWNIRRHWLEFVWNVFWNSFFFLFCVCCKLLFPVTGVEFFIFNRVKLPFHSFIIWKTEILTDIIQKEFLMSENFLHKKGECFFICCLFVCLENEEIGWYFIFFRILLDF